MKNLPLGMFDSGLGGLTVMQQIVQLLPHEDVVYFGDTARLPYGAKSPETIIRYSIENTQFLIHKNIKMMVVACNTASAHALENLQQKFSIPMLGVVSPGAESAVQSTRNGRIGVLGTKGTIHSQSYQKAIHQLDSHVEVFPVACPLFVPLVEEGCIDHPAAHLIVREYLHPLKEKGIDTLLLGCTHYPLLEELIRVEMGQGVKVVDSAISCAQKVSELLVENLLQKSSGRQAAYQYYVSDDPERFAMLGSAFLGKTIKDVRLLDAVVYHKVGF
jgi:glutamate racemase